MRAWEVRFGSEADIERVRTNVPAALVEQLKPEGRMVIPVGGAREQDLMLITKNRDGTTTNTTVVPVNFVPLVKGDTDH